MAAQTNTPTTTPTRLSGRVERVIFHAEDTGYTVFLLATGEGTKQRNHTVIGHLPEGRPLENARVEADGEWVTHRKFGEQFKASAVTVLRPEGGEGMALYLASVLDGVGEGTARKIVAKFGDKTFDVLDNYTDRLTSVRGISEKRLKGIRESWSKQAGTRAVMVFLRDIGLSAGFAKRVFDELGGPRGVDVAAQLKRNPYELTRVAGIGFIKADAAASKMGISGDDPRRVKAGLYFALETEGGNGHTGLAPERLKEQVVSLLGLGEAGEGVLGELLREALSRGELSTGYTPEGAALVQLAGTAANERKIAAFVREKARMPMRRLDPSAAIAARFAHASEEQKQALHMLLSVPFSILTGGPGMGKTTITKVLVDTAREAGQTVKLAAPTGRAAKRLGEATGQPAETIHKMLGLQPGGSADALEGDLLIVDEVSMMDTWLAARLSEAVPAEMRVIFVGDADQLPSVGPGNVLRDLIGSRIVPTARLTQVFRQVEGSGVAAGAQKIIGGERPDFATDFTLDEIDDPEEVLAALFAEAKRYLMDGRKPEQIQVLSPMRRGPLGIGRLNEALRPLLNRRAGEFADPPSLLIGDPAAGDQRKIVIGDRVLQTRNNRNLGVVNGDMGIVTSLDKAQRKLTVRFDDSTVEIEGEDLFHIEPAYAMTIHKSQGGQFPVVLMPVHNQHYIMLNRNLIYTGITRAEREARMFGQSKALAQACRVAGNMTRTTGLQAQINGVEPAPGESEDEEEEQLSLIME